MGGMVCVDARKQEARGPRGAARTLRRTPRRPTPKGRAQPRAPSSQNAAGADAAKRAYVTNQRPHAPRRTRERGAGDGGGGAALMYAWDLFQGRADASAKKQRVDARTTPIRALDHVDIDAPVCRPWAF